MNIYFIGIGGIGMSALARFFAAQGWHVAGYDRMHTALTAALSEQDGIDVCYDDQVGSIGESFRDPSDTEVVYTPAVQHDNVILNWFLGRGFNVRKRSEVLGVLCRDKYVMAVAGTHGKTTTSTMAAWFYHAASGGAGSAFLGGVSKNFGSNLVVGSGDRIAVEADEFDRSFLQLHPAVAVITSTDADHLDIYGDHSHMIEGFEAFASQVTDALVLHQGVELRVSADRAVSPASPVSSASGPLKIYRYGVGDVRGDVMDGVTVDFRAENVKLVDGGCYSFDFVAPDGRVDGLTLGVAGLINVENAVAALALVSLACLPSLSSLPSLMSLSSQAMADLKQAVADFRGVTRRFDFHINTSSLVYMDDYAHHPAELTAMISSVRGMFAGRRVTVIFQPHLYSRTRDFAKEFGEALSLADHVVLLPIYAAREEPIVGITALSIGDYVRVPCDILEDKAQLVASLSDLDLDVVITAGAGDIDKLCDGVRQYLLSRVQ